MITSRNADSTCFIGSGTSCDVIIFGNFWPNFGQKRSHHVMDFFCRSENPGKSSENIFQNCDMLSSKTKGPGEQGAAGYCPKIFLLKRAEMVLSLPGPSKGVIGKSALEIGQFPRRNFCMISWGPLREPLRGKSASERVSERTSENL